MLAAGDFGAILRKLGIFVLHAFVGKFQTSQARA